ncbi:hypothetical protein K503DRAFT_859796, partial [Rhizopogon vinicolor AM-OR11-026]
MSRGVQPDRSTTHADYHKGFWMAQGIIPLQIDLLRAPPSLHVNLQHHIHGARTLTASLRYFVVPVIQPLARLQPTARQEYSTRTAGLVLFSLDGCTNEITQTTSCLSSIHRKLRSHIQEAWLYDYYDLDSRNYLMLCTQRNVRVKGKSGKKLPAPNNIMTINVAGTSQPSNGDAVQQQSSGTAQGQQLSPQSHVLLTTTPAASATTANMTSTGTPLHPDVVIRRPGRCSIQNTGFYLKGLKRPLSRVRKKDQRRWKKNSKWQEDLASKQYEFEVMKGPG